MLSSKVARRAVLAAARRHHSAASWSLPSAAYTDPARTQEASTSSTPYDISDTQRDTLHGALRVDQAGEVAANYIYMGQLAVLGRDRATGPLIQVSMDVL